MSRATMISTIIYSIAIILGVGIVIYSFIDFLYQKLKEQKKKKK